MHIHRQKRGPFATVLAISIGIHVVAAIIFGTIRIVEYVRPPDAQFETPPPPPERIDPQKLEYKVRMQERQADSARPAPQRITVATVSDLNPPSLDAVVPALAGVGVNLSGSGRGQRGGLGSGFGTGGIGFGVSAVNFFGIRSRGERVVFIVDASKYMVEDEKGGLGAFRLVKEELGRMVGALSPGTLFNVIAYEYGDINVFRPAMVPATDTNKTSVSEWIGPINRSAGRLGAGTANYQLKALHEPLKDDVTQWVRAVQAAAELGADSIFVICAQWQFHSRRMTDEELQRWLRGEGWGDREEQAWNAAVERAKGWLEQENAARRARGQAPRIVNWIGDIVREIDPGVRARPSPSWEPGEIQDQVRTTIRALYPPTSGPVINVVLFLGRNERRPRDVSMFEDVVGPTRGKVQVLQGFEGLRSVLSVPPPATPAP